jgi:hypothetical protein
VQHAGWTALFSLGQERLLVYDRELAPCFHGCSQANLCDGFRKIISTNIGGEIKTVVFSVLDFEAIEGVHGGCFVVVVRQDNTTTTFSIAQHFTQKKFVC